MSETTARPNPIALAEMLRELANLYVALGYELSRTSAKASRGGTGSGQVPADLDVVDARRSIEKVAVNYAEVLVEETHDYEPPDSTPDILRSIAGRIGHFTHHPDALVAFEFADDVESTLESADRVAHPNGMAWVPIDRKCFTAECPGVMRVRIDRDKPMSDADLALWRPVAVCDVDGSHKVDAKLFVRDTRDTDAVA